MKSNFVIYSIILLLVVSRASAQAGFTEKKKGAPVSVTGDTTCVSLTEDEKKSLTFRGIQMPTNGCIPQQVRFSLFGNCKTDPYIPLSKKYIPGPDVAACEKKEGKGPVGITKLNADFACRLKTFLDTKPTISVINGYRSYDCQDTFFKKKLTSLKPAAQKQLTKKGAPRPTQKQIDDRAYILAQKVVAPPDRVSNHTLGVAADISQVNTLSQSEYDKLRSEVKLYGIQFGIYEQLKKKLNAQQFAKLSEARKERWHLELTVIPKEIKKDQRSQVQKQKGSFKTGSKKGSFQPKKK